MAQKNEGEAQKSGFFGRIFSSKGNSPVKAKMGEKNKFVYDEKLRRWVIPGEKVEESTFPAAPPPMSRGPSATSLSESEGPEGHRRTGSTGAGARYANPGLLAISRTGSDYSMSTASIIPSPAKPPLAPSAKPSVFVPGGRTEGTAASTGPRFFVPGGSSTTQSGSSRFAGFSSKARQAQTAAEESTAEQPPPGEEVLSPSKRPRMSDPSQQGPGESMESEVTLARGVAELESSQPSEATFAHGIPSVAEESIGENTYGEASGISDGAVTSPGPRERGQWGLRGGAAADSEAAGVEDPEGGGFGQAYEHGGGEFGLGEESYAEHPHQPQDYFGTDGAAAGDVSAAQAAYSGFEAYSGSEAYPGAEAYTGAEAYSGAEAYTGASTEEATWEEVQRLVDDYRQQGYSEEDLQAWIATTYPQFGQQQPSELYPGQVEGAFAEAAAMEGVFQEQPPNNVQQQLSNAAGVSQPAEAEASQGAGHVDKQLGSSFQEPAAAREGTPRETAFQERRRLQSEAPSDMADCGSSIGHLDDLASVGTMSQGPSQARFGRLASESSASGKLSGPLPWDVLDDRSDEENSTAGTPRFELPYPNGEAGNGARPQLAGAAFAEAAEQAGTKLTGWVTGLVRSGVQSHLTANARFPRAPLDNRNAPSSPSVSVRSGNTSTRAQQGTPTSVKSVPVEGHHGDTGSAPPSAKAARYGRGAFDNESVLSEAILEEEPDQDGNGFEPDQENRGYEPDKERRAFEPDQAHHGVGSHQDSHSFQDHTHPSDHSVLPKAADALQHGAGPQAQQAASSGVEAWQIETAGDNHADDQDGWDFDASALDDLPSADQQQEHEKQPHSGAENASAALQDTAAQVQGKQAEEIIARLPRTWEGDFAQPGADNAGFGLDHSEAIHTTGSAVDIPSRTGTNGPPSLMGESPPAGWEGGSELAFPLDDVPKDASAKPSRHASALDLPEAAALTPLRVPPLTPLRSGVSGGVASSSAAAAAVKEAFSHGDEAAQLAALQERLQEVIALHQHASDECETLRDQNGALELELADLKTQNDAVVPEARLAQDALADKAQLEEQLEELWQVAEQLRAKNDALKADNATLLAERDDDAGAAVAHSNGDLKPRSAAAGASMPAAAAELEAARQRIAELEELLEQGSGEERTAELEAQIEDLMAEAETQAEESLAKDEEIDGLEAQLAAAKQALAAAQQGTAQELEQLRKEAAAANAEVISLSDALDTLSQETTRLNQSLTARDAELEGMRADLAAQAADAQLLADLQSQLATRETEIARLQGELSSKEDELARIAKEAPAKEATEKKLRAALKHTKEAAAKERSELTAQLEAAQQAVSDAQAQAQRLTAELSELQDGKAAAQQQCAQIEAEVKTLKENVALDFERIGLLSEENAALQEKVDELEAAGGSGVSAESAAELTQLRDEVAAAVARAEEAEARAKTLAQEKESFGKRGAKLQAKLNRVQAEFQEKQAQLTKDLEDAKERASVAERQAAEAEAERATLAQAVEQEESTALQERDALKSEASALAAQVAELQATVAAESQRREEAEQHLAAAAQDAAELAASKRALSEELAAEKNKVAELEEEASALFKRASAAEDEAGAAEARAHSLAQKLEAAQASLQAAEQGESSGGAALEEELAQVKAEAAEQEAEFGEMLACLGQESAKVAALQDLLLQHGLDPSGVLAQVEADYGFDGEGDGGEDAEGQEGEQQAAGDPQAHEYAAENTGLKAQEGPGSAADAPADQEWPGFSADASAAEAEQEEQLPASSAQHAQHAHQSSIEGLPEGELLSPDKGLPSLREDVKSEITAGINFGGVHQAHAAAPDQEIDFDGWGADADGDWGLN